MRQCSKESRKNRSQFGMVWYSRDFRIRETGTGQQMAQFHERYDDDDDDDDDVCYSFV